MQSQGMTLTCFIFDKFLKIITQISLEPKNVPVIM